MGIMQLKISIDKREWAILISIVFGVILHLVAILNHYVLFDGTAYIAMARSFAARGEFYMDWGALWPPNTYIPGYSHWCAPLYPLYLSGYYFVFGYSIEITMVASFISALIAIIAVYFATRSLFDRYHGLLASAIIALNPLLILLTAYNFSENLVVATFTMGMWAMIKGIKDERYLPIAGVFASLGYLSRSNVGYFFIIAALIGMIWRYKFLGTSFLKNKYYLYAMAIFSTVFAIWTGRNLYRFGFPNWETNPMITEIMAFAFTKPLDLMVTFILKLILFAVIFLTLASFFIDTLQIKEILKDDEESGYFLGIFLPIFIALFFMASYHVYLSYHGMEKPIFWEEGARYVLISDVPLLWLVFKKYSFGEGHEPNLKKRPIVIVTLASFGTLALIAVNVLRSVFIFIGLGTLLSNINYRKRFAIILILLTITSTIVAMHVDKPGYVKAAKVLNNHIRDNETLAIDFGVRGGSIYNLYPYLDNMKNRPIIYEEGCNTTYIISTVQRAYEGYELIGIYESDYGFMGLGKGVFQGVGGEKGITYLWKKTESII